MATRDYDFIGFTYGGKHSIDDYGIYRTSDGSRYNDNLIPQLNDKTADIPGGDGQYYFYSTHKTKQFSIPIAFDSMTESTYRLVKQWLNGKNIEDLVFDEAPYKTYSAKVTGTPQLKTICFVEKGERIYKGEGTIQFTCYYPYAHTPTTTKNGLDGRALSSYSNEFYPTKNEWAPGCGMLEAHYDGCNYGDLPAPFIVTTKRGLNFIEDDQFIVGDLTITLKEKCSNLEWDSRTGLIYTTTPTQAKQLLRFSGKSFGAIPVTEPNKPVEIYYRTFENDREVKYYPNGKKVIEGIGMETADPPFTIEYNYWYY